MSELDVEHARYNMVEQQIRPWNVLNQQILDLMGQMPREDFVPPALRDLAFADTTIPIAQGQVMMQPKLEAKLLQALALEPTDSVLEIGTGSGFLTACLGTLASQVYSIDIFPEFQQSAAQHLQEHHIHNVRLDTKDAFSAWSATQRFDAIAVTGSLPVWNKQFQDLLNIAGRLFVVVGSAPAMQALLITRVSESSWRQESLFETVLPALINAQLPAAFQF